MIHNIPPKKKKKKNLVMFLTLLSYYVPLFGINKSSTKKGQNSI